MPSETFEDFKNAARARVLSDPDLAESIGGEPEPLRASYENMLVGAYMKGVVDHAMQAIGFSAYAYEEMRDQHL